MVSRSQALCFLRAPHTSEAQGFFICPRNHPLPTAQQLPLEEGEAGGFFVLQYTYIPTNLNAETKISDTKKYL